MYSSSNTPYYSTVSTLPPLRVCIRDELVYFSLQDIGCAAYVTLVCFCDVCVVDVRYSIYRQLTWVESKWEQWYKL